MIITYHSFIIHINMFSVCIISISYSYYRDKKADTNTWTAWLDDGEMVSFSLHKYQQILLTIILCNLNCSSRYACEWA